MYNFVQWRDIVEKTIKDTFTRLHDLLYNIFLFCVD